MAKRQVPMAKQKVHHWLILCADYVAGENLVGGISPPLGLPKLQHPQCTANP